MSREPEIVTKFRKLLVETSEEDLQAMAFNSPALHFALFMEIKDKNGRWIRPEPNVLQLRISQTIETLRDFCPGTRIRIIAVKPRRAGLSTFSLHCGYHEAMRRPIEGITIADCKKNSNMLIERLGEFSSHDDFPWEARVTRNVEGLFEWDNGSRWTIDTAENPDAGVGGTRHFGHFSECSKYPQTAIKNDVKTMTAALPSFSGSETICIAESTPEGSQGWFYGTFDSEAMWLEDFLKRYEAGFRPEQQWIKVFAAWWEFDDYRRQNPVSEAEREEIERTLSDVEREEREKYGLTYEQLAWRRETIAGECDGDPRIFAYYYPSDPISCWIASGTPRFDTAILSEMKKKAKDETPDTGYLVTQRPGKVSWSRDQRGGGEIMIREFPIEGCAYIVACDPATGESQTVGADPDRTSICVWRQKFFDPDLNLSRPAKLVARVRPPFTGDDDIAAGHIVRLSDFYGGCIIALEVNQGLQILRCLLDAKRHLFKRIVFSHKTNAKEEQYGFKLNDQNQRRMIIDGLAPAIRNGEIDPDLHTIEEMLKFVRKPNGRYEAAGGAHDDDCFVAGTAILTLHGWRPIETIAIGDMVMTRDGLRPIGHIYSKRKPVIANLGLIGTATHPIITPNGEMSLTDAKDTDSLFTWNEKSGMIEKRSFTEARNTTDTLHQSADSCVFIFGDMTNGNSLLLRSIGRFGLMLMEKSQKAALSITSTATRSITRLETLRSWLLGITPESTWKIRNKNTSCGRQVEGKPHESSNLLPTGNNPPKASGSCPRTPKSAVPYQANTLMLGERLTPQKESTARTENETRPNLSQPWQSGESNQKPKRFTLPPQEKPSSLSRESLRAWCVDLLLLPLFATLRIALLSAKLEQLIRKRLQRRRVYNLYVEGTHEYFANGILVHNCMSAAMAWEVLPSATVYARRVVREIDPPDMAKGNRAQGWRVVSNVKRGW